ncbi:hypothetical protein ACLB2K_011475 [Fragaria x ananassa]
MSPGVLGMRKHSEEDIFEVINHRKNVRFQTKKRKVGRSLRSKNKIPKPTKKTGPPQLLVTLHACEGKKVSPTDVIEPENCEWRFTGFYGHADTGQRHISWNLLLSLYRGQTDKWVVAGDINEILQLSEKSRGRIRNIYQMLAFREALTDCHLDDMGAAGGWFTWNDSHTKERLDRGLCTQAWLAEFNFSRVIALPPSRSSSPARVDNSWAVPQSGSPVVQVCCKIRDSGSHFLNWDYTVFQARRKELENVRLTLQESLQNPFDRAD